VDTGRDYPQKLTITARRYGNTLVRREYPYFTHLAGLEKHGIFVWIYIRCISYIAIVRRIFMLRIPHGATIVDAASDQYADATIESDTVRR